MYNEEELLTHFNFIIGLKNAGFSMRQMAQDVNYKFKCQIKPRQLRYFIDKVANKTIHNEYNNIIMFDSSRSTWDKNLSKYCVDFKGLLITYKCLSNLSDSEFVITSDNLVSLVSKRSSILYAKRILKLYHIDDETLIEQHRKCWSTQLEINLPRHLEEIHVGFNHEFNKMLTELHKLYINFLATGYKGVSYAPTKKV